ncbi:hypothetical protein ACSNOU_05060 [Acinetobacter oleivorans]|uniref:hypothetical protein n=1 Tax=Acinetobacter oleivorans TaxID=1148157 RepID=UPI003F1CD0F7
MKNIDLNTVLTLSITYFISVFLGFHYMAGRAYLEGLTVHTGIDYPFLGFEFSDYVFYGFLNNFQILLILPLIIGTICFLYILYRTIKNNRRKTDEEIANNMWKLETYIFLILAGIIVSVFIIALFPLKAWLSDQNDGVNTKLKALEQETSFISVNNEKYFLLVCGKDRCLYGKKDLSNYYSLKKDEHKTSNLPYYQIINYYNNTELDFAYLIDQKIEKKKKVYIFQVSRSKFPLKRDIYFSLKAKSYKGHDYLPEIKIEAAYLNSIYREETNAYFISFSLPVDENIEQLYILNEFTKN